MQSQRLTALPRLAALARQRPACLPSMAPESQSWTSTAMPQRPQQLLKKTMFQARLGMQYCFQRLESTHKPGEPELFNNKKTVA